RGQYIVTPQPPRVGHVLHPSRRRLAAAPVASALRAVVTGLQPVVDMPLSPDIRPVAHLFNLYWYGRHAWQWPCDSAEDADRLVTAWRWSYYAGLLGITVGVTAAAAGTVGLFIRRAEG